MNLLFWGKKIRPKSIFYNIYNPCNITYYNISAFQKQKENRDVSPAPVVNTEQFKKPATPLAPRQQKGHRDPALQELKQTNAPKVMRSPKAEEPRVTKSTAVEGPTISQSPKAVPVASAVKQSRTKLYEVCCNFFCKMICFKEEWVY